MRINVRLYLDWPSLYPIFCEAIAFRAIPASWRPSEYAMTKATALEAAQKAEHAKKGWQIEQDYFLWACLLSELARLAHHRRHAKALDAYFQLRDACYSVPGVKELEERTQRMADLQNEIDEAEAQLAFMRRQFQQEALDSIHAYRQSKLAPEGVVAVDHEPAPQPETAGDRPADVDKMPSAR